jgi:hypothetical protein
MVWDFAVVASGGSAFAVLVFAGLAFVVLAFVGAGAIGAAVGRLPGGVGEAEDGVIGLRWDLQLVSQLPRIMATATTLGPMGTTAVVRTTGTLAAAAIAAANGGSTLRGRASEMPSAASRGCQCSSPASAVIRSLVDAGLATTGTLGHFRRASVASYRVA